MMRRILLLLLAASLMWTALAIHVSADAGEIYVVQPGDTLSAIAQRYQISVRSIAQANGLADPNRIRVGQKLVIPDTASTAVVPLGEVVPYRVQRGDTLFLLARRYGTTIEDIMALNHLSDANLIRVGQLLLIPTKLNEDAPRLPVGPISAVRVVPPVAQQGQTLSVRVRITGTATLFVTFDGMPLRMSEDDAGYWGLAPVSAVAAPGRKDLVIQATTDEGVTELTWPVWVIQGEFPIQYIQVPESKGGLLDPVKVQEEQARLAAVWSQSAPERLWDGLFVTPLAPGYVISSPFGARRSYNDGPVDSYHAGQDFAAPGGTPVVAPAAGRVVLAEPLTVRGNAVVIDHGMGVHTGYWHLSTIHVSEGQEVAVGDLIGEVGTTGLSTGDHLHWEMRVLGVPVDPLEWTRRVFP